MFQEVWQLLNELLTSHYRFNTIKRNLHSQQLVFKLFESLKHKVQ